jgi:hypothetical protein
MSVVNDVLAILRIWPFETITIREQRLKCLLVARIFATASAIRIWSGSIIDQIKETYHLS